MNVFEKIYQIEPKREHLFEIERHKTIEKPYPLYQEDLIPLIKENSFLEVKEQEKTQNIEDLPINESKKTKKNSRTTSTKSSKRSNKI